MSRRLAMPLVAAVLLAAGGCYQDDSVTTVNRKPVARVLLTDAPFPYDSLGSVNVYVVRIEANAESDTSGTGNWVLVTEPGKSFDLLALQQGATALLGEGELPAGQYHSIRMTIDTNRSSIIWNSAGQAPVNRHDKSAIYTFVDYPVSGTSRPPVAAIRPDTTRSPSCVQAATSSESKSRFFHTSILWSRRTCTWLRATRRPCRYCSPMPARVAPRMCASPGLPPWVWAGRSPCSRRWATRTATRSSNRRCRGPAATRRPPA